MKKYLLFLATVALVASCSDQDTFKKDIQTGDDGAISFETFTSKQTRGAENSVVNYDWAFFDHHSDFQVWGYKNTSDIEVFDGDVVTVTETSTNPRTFNYAYSPIRYWDKAASKYEYYAAAPAIDGAYDATTNPNGWNFVTTRIEDATKQNLGYFETQSTLQGSNITATSGDQAYKYADSFKEVSDVDKMIAAPKSVAKANFNEQVQLDFIHILSRLNVTIKKADALDGKVEEGGTTKYINRQKVILKDLQVVNLLCKGHFKEYSESVPAAVPSGSYARWSDRETTTPYVSVATDQNNTEVLTSARYILQSLVIPQPSAFENVALDGEYVAGAAAVSYQSLDEYNEAHDPDIDQAAWEQLSDEEKIKTPAVIEMKSTTSNDDAKKATTPYLKIVYTIQQITDKDGNDLSDTTTPKLKDPEEFVAYFNLAAAFGMDGVTTGKIELPFNEGWQNTLNVIINPSKIEFAADIAVWASTPEKTLTVE